MKSRGRGFTLIELLVVIAIIGVLTALLATAFVRARQKARQGECLSNVKNVAMALQMYLSDYGCLPPGEHRAEVLGFFRGIRPSCSTQYITWANPYLRWPVVLEEYIRNRDVWRCPEARLADPMRITPGPNWLSVYATHPGEQAQYGGTCHPNYPPGWGGAITDSWAQQAAAVPRGTSPDESPFPKGIGTNGNAYDLMESELRDPSRYVLCFDAGGQQEPSDTSMGIAYPDICRLGCASCGDNDTRWESCPQILRCGAYTSRYGTDVEFRRERCPARHMGGDNIGFADGHAKWFPAETVLWGAEDHRRYLPMNAETTEPLLLGVWVCRFGPAGVHLPEPGWPPPHH